MLCCTLLLAAGCSSQRKNFFSKTYHNTTALYNAYFIAREDIRTVEAAIEASHRNDYDRLLPVFSDIDSATIGAQREVLDDCLKKASLAIQRHENSKWVDDSYYLVGKARFYGGDFVNAIETFKYINTRSDDDHQRHAALVALMRTFIHYGEMNNAQAVSDFLQKQRLNRENLLELYLTRAYLYQLAGDRRQLAHNLAEAVQLQGNKKKNARHYYILGQIYQEEGQDDKAYEYFRKSLKSSPEYELSFYARINMARSSRAGQPVDDKKVQRFFSKMLKDSKNREFRDRIYFEMARYELRRGNTDTGIDYLKAAARESAPNSRIRPMAFLRLAEIYYGETKNFVLAKAYYDSTVAVFPREDERFPGIESRQKILGEFVAQLETIYTQDSLLRLAAMDPAELDALLDRVIRENREREEALARQQQIEARRQNSGQAPFGDEPWAAAGPAPEQEGSVWYFYNSAAVSMGQNEFLRRWGNRPLEDNWRRSRKESLAAFETETAADEEPDDSGPADAVSEADASARQKADMMATLPMDEEAKAQSLGRIEEAYYRLGNIYYFDLAEPVNARGTFDTLLIRFPESEYTAEVLYQLFLICTAVDSAAAIGYRDRLVAGFPESLYARLALNPNYQEESVEVSDRLQRLYRIAYGYYEAGDYNQAGLLVRRGLEQFPDNSFSDYLRVLGIMITGREEGQFRYQYELQRFTETYPESPLLGYVAQLLEASRNFEANEARRSGARFVPSFDEPHLFVVVYENLPVLSEALGEVLEDYLQNYHPGETLNVGSLGFDEQQALALISKFPARDEARRFLEEFESRDVLAARFEGHGFRYFVITESNFQLLFRSKRLEDYLAFFKANYSE